MNGTTVGSAFGIMLSLVGGMAWWVYNEQQQMQRQIDRLWEAKAERLDTADRWRLSQHIEYAARVDTELRGLQRQIDDLRGDRNAKLR